MKIVMINDSYYPYGHGGAESYIQSISQALIEEYDHEIVIVSSKPFNGVSSLFPQKNIVSKNFTIYRFYPLNLYHRSKQANANKLAKISWYVIDELNWHSYSLVKKILKKESPDLVHTHNLRGISPLIFKAANSFKIPHVHTIHDVYLVSPGIVPKNIMEKKFWEFYKNMNKSILHSPDFVISPSFFALRTYLKAGLFRESPRIVLRNPPRFELCPCIKRYTSLNITYIGSLTISKGVLLFLEAVNQIMKNDNIDETIHFHIVGTGPLLEYVKRYIRDKKLQNVVLHGYLSGSKLAQIYKISNIVVVPSIVSETLCQVIMESFAHATPVVASNIGGIPEIVKHGYNGILVSPNNPDALKAKIIEAIMQHRKLKKLEKHAFKTAKKYSITNHVYYLNKIYSTLIP